MVDLNQSKDTVMVLKKHEKCKKDFAGRKIDGFGMRDFFWEEEMLNGGVMNEEKATKLGYIRVIDYQRTKKYLIYNQAIMDHATAEIKPEKKVFNFKTILLANFAFTMRIILYHIFMVALANSPLILIVMLMVIELSYMILIIKNFIILKYLISVHLFASKVTQSAFLFFFHVVSLLIHM
jgi:hypothetical protein